MVFKKIRYEDGHVEIRIPEVMPINDHTPVLIDDIISSGKTMIKALQLLKAQGINSPYYIAIHPLFAGDSYQQLQDIGVKKIVTCNTISYPSNQIDLTLLLAQALKEII